MNIYTVNGVQFDIQGSDKFQANVRNSLDFLNLVSSTHNDIIKDISNSSGVHPAPSIIIREVKGRTVVRRADSLAIETADFVIDLNPSLTIAWQGADGLVIDPFIEASLLHELTHISLGHLNSDPSQLSPAQRLEFEQNSVELTNLFRAELGLQQRPLDYLYSSRDASGIEANLLTATSEGSELLAVLKSDLRAKFKQKLLNSIRQNPKANLSEIIERALKKSGECFPSGTLVSMWPVGVGLEPNAGSAYDERQMLAGVWHKPIEEIVPGDMVLSFNGDGKLVPGFVDKLFHNVTQEFVRLTFDNSHDDLVATPGHRFLTETDDFMEIGHMLRLGGGKTKPLVSVLRLR